MPKENEIIDNMFNEWAIDNIITSNPAFKYCHRKYNRLIIGIKSNNVFQDNHLYYEYHYINNNENIKMIIKNKMITYYIFNKERQKLETIRFMKKDNHLVVTKCVDKYIRTTKGYRTNTTYFVSEYDEYGIEINKRTVSINPPSKLTYLELDSSILHNTIMMHNNCLDKFIPADKLYITDESDVIYEDNMYRDSCIEQITFGSELKSTYGNIISEHGILCALDYPKDLAFIPSKRKDNCRLIPTSLDDYNENIKNKYRDMDIALINEELTNYHLNEITIEKINQELERMNSIRLAKVLN